MKFTKYLFSFMCCTFWMVSEMRAQVAYDFDYYIETYESLEDDEIVFDVVNYSLWGNDEWTLPLEFTFNFMGNDYETILISNGKIRFDEDNDEVYIFPYFTELIDRNYWNNPIVDIISPVSYKYENQNGQTILKIQHENVGFFDGGPADFANFQTWLYEGSNIIEFHYGASEIISETAFSSQDEAIYGPLVGIIDGDHTNPYYLVYQNSESPEILTDPENYGEGLIGSPPNNMVYRFIPNTVNTIESEFIENSISISPNPAHDQFSIFIEKPNLIKRIEIFNGVGKIKHTLLNINTQNDINIGFAAGVYLVKIVQNDGAFIVEKIILCN